MLPTDTDDDVDPYADLPTELVALLKEPPPGTWLDGSPALVMHLRDTLREVGSLRVAASAVLERLALGEDVPADEYEALRREVER